MMLIIGVLLLLGLLTLSSCSPTESFNWGRIEHVYSFGDSYSFVPGTYGLPHFSFIGDGTRLAFTREQLLTSKIMGNQTSSGGFNWLQFLTGCFEGFPSSCPRQLWVFAHGGADIDSHLLSPSRPTTVQLDQQVQQWLDYAANILPRPAKKTLTIWWMGINDCSHATKNQSITDMDAFLDADLEAYFTIIGKTARKGLKTHLLLNVPPIDRSPFAEKILTGPIGLKKTIGQFNEKLVTRVQKFADDNPDQHIMFFDAAAIFTHILDNPAQFGLNDTTTFCTGCAEERQHFWHNDEHPTEFIHSVLASELEKFLGDHKGRLVV